MSGMPPSPLHQFRFDQKAFWRNPASVFFTVMFPVIFLLIFATDLRQRHDRGAGGVKTTTYYVPAIITLAVVSATVQSLAISAHRRPRERPAEAGRGARRCRPGSFIAGRVGNSIVVSVLMLRPGRCSAASLYGVEIPRDDFPRCCVTLAVGAASFCCLGFALTAAIPSRGRGGADHQRGGAAPLLPLGRLRPRERDPRGRAPGSPTCSRSATSSRPSSPPGTRARPEPASSWGTWRWSPPGGSPAC